MCTTLSVREVCERPGGHACSRRSTTQVRSPPSLFERHTYFLDLLRVPLRMYRDHQEHLITIDWPRDEGVLRDPAARINVQPTHPLNGPCSRGGESREGVLQMAIAAPRPCSGRRFNALASIDSSFPDQAFPCRVRRSRCRSLGCHQPRKQKLLRYRQVLDTLEDRPTRRLLFPDRHMLIDVRQGFGKSLPALIQLSQDLLLFRRKHVLTV